MASSGIAVNPECTAAYDELKKDRLHSYVIFKINDKEAEFIVDKKSGKDATYDELVEDLKAATGPKGPEGRYAVYNAKIKSKSGGDAEKIIFIAWNPDNSHVKRKMLYASSKDGFVKKLEGVEGNKFQAADESDLDWEPINKSLVAKTQ